MAEQFISIKVYLMSISYFKGASEVSYVFGVDGLDREFKAVISDNSGIKALNCNDGLEVFLMSLMPIDKNIFKKISAISWRYVEGDKLEFPIELISLDINK